MLLVLIIALVVICIVSRSTICYSEGQASHPKDPSGRDARKFQILANTGFCCASGRFCSGSEEWKQTNVVEPTSHQINIPKGIGPKNWAIFFSKFMVEVRTTIGQDTCSNFGI